MSPHPLCCFNLEKSSVTRVEPQNVGPYLKYEPSKQTPSKVIEGALKFNINWSIEFNEKYKIVYWQKNYINHIFLVKSKCNSEINSN